MSAPIEVQAELQRLGRLLRVEVEQLSYLADLAETQLRELRLQITDVLYAPNGMLERIAAANKLVPAAVAVTIGEKVFGPVIVARLVPLLDVDRAVEMSGRLPVAFLADVGAVLDPRRARDVLARIPPERIAAASAELVRRGEYIALGSYVGALPDASLRAALDGFDSDSLLQTALVLEQKDRMAEVFELAGTGALEGAFGAAQRLGLEPEARQLLPYLSAEQRAQVSPLLSAT